MNIQLENIYKSRIKNRRYHPMAKDMGFPAFVVKMKCDYEISVELKRILEAQRHQ